MSSSEEINSTQQLEEKLKEWEKGKAISSFCVPLSSSSSSSRFIEIPLITPGWSIEKIARECCPESWEKIFQEAFPLICTISKFIEGEEKEGKIIYPTKKDIFKVFNLCTPDKIKVCILGQDPYPGEGQAHGIAFSCLKGIPSSLSNIFKELRSDIPEVNISMSKNQNGDLTKWVDQGVFLINTALTVRAGDAGSHVKEWKPFTIRILNEISQINPNLIVVMWGAKAKEFQSCLSPSCTKLSAAHPSGYSASKGFFGCKHFSQINKILIQQKKKPINWDLTH